MEKKVLIVSTSLRKNSNSERLAEEFAKGAVSEGHQVEVITLGEKQIGFCKGCLACQSNGKCVIKDDALEIAEKMKASDIVVFASPIYYYEMSGQMKALLDRMNPLYGSDYKFTDIYFLASAADQEEKASERAVSGLQGWIDCFERARLMGTVFAGGVTEAGEIDGQESLKQAYKMGMSV